MSCSSVLLSWASLIKWCKSYILYYYDVNFIDIATYSAVVLSIPNYLQTSAFVVFRIGCDTDVVAVTTSITLLTWSFLKLSF